jgi:hypothetical protein
LDTDATVGGGIEPDAGTSLDSSIDGHPTHSGLHKHLGDAVQQLEAKIGIGSATPVANRVLLSTVTGSSSWAQVDTNQIADSAVTTAKIEDDAVTAAKLHPDAVTGVVVANTSDTTCNVALFESATGTLGPKTDAGITYNASTGLLSLTQATVSGYVNAVNFIADAGSTGTAAYAFDGDLDTGMYKSADNEISFTTNGSQRVKITSGGTLIWVNSSGIGGPLTDTSSTSGFRYVLQNQVFGTLQDFTSIRDRKEQITNVTAIDSGRWIDGLQPVTFIERWLGEGDEPEDNRTYREADVQVGFIADDVLSNADTSLFAQATDNGHGGLDPSGWKWECVIAAAVAEIKALRARVTALEG